MEKPAENVATCKFCAMRLVPVFLAKVADAYLVEFEAASRSAQHRGDCRRGPRGLAASLAGEMSEALRMGAEEDIEKESDPLPPTHQASQTYQRHRHAQAAEPRTETQKPSVRFESFRVRRACLRLIQALTIEVRKDSIKKTIVP